MRAALYCRLSEEDKTKRTRQEDSVSIQNQKEMLTQYAHEQGWKIVQIYSDEDYAGADRNRPAFRQLLEDAQNRRFDIVLCKTQSRFTRELELVEKYIHGLFPQWGIRFVSVVDHADTENKGNKKSRQINGLVNEWYLEDLSENIRSVLKSRRQNGYHIGAFALYGYRKDLEHKGHLVIDEEAASVVREVFSLFSQGYGKTAIARILNERGIPNPTEYKRLHGLRYQQPHGKNSTLWRYSAISSMLTNEIYIGNLVQGRYGSVSYKTKQNRPRPQSEWYVVEGTHEAIIDRDLWERVQEMIAQRAKPFQHGKIGLFAGKVRCASCGYSLRSSRSHNRDYLQCATRMVSKDACPGAFISVERLEKIVLDELCHITEQQLDVEELYCQVQKRKREDSSQEKGIRQLEVWKKQEAQITQALHRLYWDWRGGNLPEEDYLTMSQNTIQERQRLRERIEKMEKTVCSHKIEDAQKGSDEKRFFPPERLTREMVDEMIEFIAIGKRIEGSRDIPVEIHWKF